MTREEKANVIEELVHKFSTVDYFYITDASGMSVARVNDFRRMCFERGIEYRVAKNTLISKALQKVESNADYGTFDGEVLKGFSGILFSPESGSAPAKLLKDFYKKEKQDKKTGFRPELKAASVDQALFMGADQLEALTSVKSKAELLGDLVTLLQSPMRNVLGALQSGSNTLSGLLKTLGDREDNA